MAAKPRFDNLAPRAELFESMRATGYTLSSAIADLIDNSIAAGSRNIWLNFHWEEDASWISVTDDGSGMTEKELMNAMTLLSRSPRDARKPKDLGRFGLGLKTAAISQARRLTVITRPKSGGRFLRCWDLDYLAKHPKQGWACLRDPHPETGDRCTDLEKRGLKRGTQVLLEVLDRVTGDSFGHVAEDHFVEQIPRVEEHLEMVFHRFLARVSRPVRIYLNDNLLSPWDPFLEAYPATQALPPDFFKQPGEAGRVEVQGFVLPHKDKFKKDAKKHQRAGGPEGWNAQQGFYLYRAERLIIAGDWLKLGWQKEEHYKLARIRLDIPNSMDDAWQIDVKKSTAAPPPVLKEWLRGIAAAVRKEAKQVYSHRGKYGRGPKPKKEQPKPWLSRKRPDGEYSYKIDRKHVAVKALIGSLSKSKKEELDALLGIIEETVPVQQIRLDSAEDEAGGTSPFSQYTDARLKKLLLRTHQAVIDLSGKSPEQAWDVLATDMMFQAKNAQAIIGQLRTEKNK